MKGTYWQKGEALDYLNSTDAKIEHGDVVTFGKRIGVAGDNILPGETGTLHVAGVYGFKRADTDDIAMGTEVYLTDEGITAQAQKEDKTENTRAGFVAAPSKGDTVYVKINA